jgi:hypothetical protein
MRDGSMKQGIGVKLQQVVHSIRIREADGDETAVSKKRTEWTTIRMPD